MHRFGLDASLLPGVWRLALPVILTNLLLTSVNIADVFMVGRLGPIEIAAVGIANSVRMLVLVAVLSVSAGAMALAAQAKGARDPQRLSFVTRQSLSLLTLMALALGSAGWFAAEPILTFLNSGGDPRAVELGTGRAHQALHIVAGRQAIGSKLTRHGEQIGEFRAHIAANAGDRRAP